MNHELLLGLITKIIGEDELQVVVAVFREIDDATMLIGMKDGQRVAWLNERLEIPA